MYCQKHSTWPRGPYKEQKPTLIHQGQTLFPPQKKKKIKAEDAPHAARRIATRGYWNVAPGQLPAYRRHHCQQSFQASAAASEARPRLFPGTLHYLKALFHPLVRVYMPFYSRFLSTGNAKNLTSCVRIGPLNVS